MGVLRNWAAWSQKDGETGLVGEITFPLSVGQGESMHLAVMIPHFPLPVVRRDVIHVLLATPQALNTDLS